MNTSRGFGKLSTQGKEKVALRKALREIQSIAKGSKGALQECKQLEETHPTPEGFEPKHWQEWTQGSGVDPEVTSLNLKSLSGNVPYDYLLYSSQLTRTNTGRLSSGILKRYHHLGDGGWWCNGVDVLAGEDSLWGCFKPNNPKFDEQKGKHRKYEHPEKVATEIFALKIPHRLWQLVARRYNVALPDGYENLPHSAFWKWVLDHPQIPIILCEGAKKAAAILSCGYVAVALPGVWNGLRQPKDEDGNPDGMASLIPQLQVFAQPGRRVYFCFDQDSKRQSARSVSKALAKTAKLFLFQKCQVKVISWLAAMGKGVDDVLVAFGRGKFDELYRGALTFDEWSSQQLRQLTYTPDMVINQRYIGEILPPHDAQLIAVKAPKGCGKTEWFRWLTAPQVSSGERKTLLITHRIQLGIQTSDRLNIPFISEVKSLDQGSLFGYALCVDSLHASSQARFNPQEWRGAWVIIDEIQQVLWHLLSSDTCKKDRVAIIKTLQELLRTVIATGGKIIVADADLNDTAVDFIEGLLGFSPARFILVNEYKFVQPWTIYRFGGKNPAGMIAELEKRLQAGEKALLCVSGQRAKSKWGSQVLQQYFKGKYPHLKILRVDSESVANPEHEACGCTQDLDKIVTNYDLVISSPTIETGVSIDVEHFDGVWLIGQGVQTADGARQNLARVRPPVPRYVWIKSQGINFVGNRSTTPAGLVASQKKLDKANRAKLSEAGLEMPDGNFSAPCLDAWAKLGAVINAGMWRYEATILKDSEEEGHIVLDWEDRVVANEGEEEDNQGDSDSSADRVKNEVTAVRDAVYQKYREDVSAADSLPDTEYEKLSKQQQRKTDELLQLRKGALERKYLVPVSPGLVEKDDNRWGSKLRLHYFWDAGRQYLQFKDGQTAEKAIVTGAGDYFIPDSNKSLIGLKVAGLDFFGIGRLYTDTGFHNEHDVIKDIVEKVANNLYYIKLTLGCDLGGLVKNPKKRIELVQVLLGLIGHRMVCYSRKGKRGAEVRLYSSPAPEFQRDPETNKLILDSSKLPIPLSDGRELVFEAWLQRDAELKRKADEQKAAEEEASRQAEEAAAAEEATRQEWLSPESLQELADTLQICESSKDLADIRGSIPAYALREASRLITDSQVKTRIAEWVKQQNACGV
ncbi:plasmid replication protein, CyRepA1 family [Scytonema sp. PCC 10023]|uniref:plasmid replication protein, CyRepA1 family n=1 Tax=Scytonema sp. PCC 10023 TaxID=1680591 RepID=UPI0039C66BFF